MSLISRVDTSRCIICCATFCGTQQQVEEIISACLPRFRPSDTLRVKRTKNVLGLRSCNNAPALQFWTTTRKIFAFLASIMVILFVRSPQADARSAPLRIDLSDRIVVAPMPSSNTPTATLEELGTVATQWHTPSEFRKNARWKGRYELWYRFNFVEVNLSEYTVPVLILPFVIQALSVYSEGIEVYSWGREHRYH